MSYDESSPALTKYQIQQVLSLNCPVLGIYLSVKLSGTLSLAQLNDGLFLQVSTRIPKRVESGGTEARLKLTRFMP